MHHCFDLILKVTEVKNRKIVIPCILISFTCVTNLAKIEPIISVRMHFCGFTTRGLKLKTFNLSTTVPLKRVNTETLLGIIQIYGGNISKMFSN